MLNIAVRDFVILEVVMLDVILLEVVMLDCNAGCCNARQNSCLRFNKSYSPFDKMRYLYEEQNGMKTAFPGFGVNR